LIRLRSTIAALAEHPGEPLAAESLAVQVGQLRRQVYLALSGPLQQEFDAVMPREPQRPSGNFSPLASLGAWHGASVQLLSSMLGWIDGQIGVEQLKAQVQAKAKQAPGFR
jgi:hypothetical protein